MQNSIKSFLSCKKRCVFSSTVTRSAAEVPVAPLTLVVPFLVFTFYVMKTVTSLHRPLATSAFFISYSLFLLSFQGECMVVGVYVLKTKNKENILKWTYPSVMQITFNIFLLFSFNLNWISTKYTHLESRAVKPSHSIYLTFFFGKRDFKQSQFQFSYFNSITG